MSNKSFIYWGIYNFCPENIAFVTKIISILDPTYFISAKTSRAKKSRWFNPSYFVLQTKIHYR